MYYKIIAITNEQTRKGSINNPFKREDLCSFGIPNSDMLQQITGITTPTLTDNQKISLIAVTLKHLNDLNPRTNNFFWLKLEDYQSSPNEAKRVKFIRFATDGGYEDGSTKRPYSFKAKVSQAEFDQTVEQLKQCLTPDTKFNIIRHVTLPSLPIPKRFDRLMTRPNATPFIEQNTGTGKLYFNNLIPSDPDILRIYTDCTQAPIFFELNSKELMNLGTLKNPIPQDMLDTLTTYTSIPSIFEFWFQHFPKQGQQVVYTSSSIIRMDDQRINVQSFKDEDITPLEGMDYDKFLIFLFDISHSCKRDNLSGLFNDTYVELSINNDGQAIITTPTGKVRRSDEGNLIWE